MYRRMIVAAATLALAALCATAPAHARTARGEFSVIEMVHTQNSSFGNLPGVNAWDGVKRAGTLYRYRGIPCTGNAPVNNIASDLPSYGGRVPGSRAPSSLRAHPFSFDLRKRNGRWQMRGRITFTVCQVKPGPVPESDPRRDEDREKILVTFRARSSRVNAEVVNWSGRFRLRGGTGRYEGLSGSGDIAGYFFCFNPRGCRATGGNYLDGQFVMHGTYADRSPLLG